MARREEALEINRMRHGCIWWLCAGWWERPIATIFLLLLASIRGYKDVKFHYYQ